MRHLVGLLYLDGFWRLTASFENLTRNEIVNRFVLGKKMSMPFPVLVDLKIVFGDPFFSYLMLNKLEAADLVTIKSGILLRILDSITLFFSSQLLHLLHLENLSFHNWAKFLGHVLIFPYFIVIFVMRFIHEYLARIPRTTSSHPWH